MNHSLSPCPWHDHDNIACALLFTLNSWNLLLKHSFFFTWIFIRRTYEPRTSWPINRYRYIAKLILYGKVQAHTHAIHSYINYYACIARKQARKFLNTYLTNNVKCPLTMRRWGKNRLCIKYDENDDHLIIQRSAYQFVT